MMKYTPNDEAVYQAVKAMRLATIFEIMKYTGFAVKNAEKHILRAKRFNLIFPKDRGSTVKHLYVIDKTYFSRISELIIGHELMISQIHAYLHRTGLLNSDEWQQGNHLDTPLIRPDAFFTINNGRPLDFYLEADNYRKGKGDNRKQMDEKTQNYLSHFEASLSNGGTPFKVLTVTTSDERARNLAKNAEQFVSEKKRKLYLFTTIERLKENILGDICFIPYKSEPYPILPPPYIINVAPS